MADYTLDPLIADALSKQNLLDENTANKLKRAPASDIPDAIAANPQDAIVQAPPEVGVPASLSPEAPAPVRQPASPDVLQASMRPDMPGASILNDAVNAPDETKNIPDSVVQSANEIDNQAQLQNQAVQEQANKLRMPAQEHLNKINEHVLAENDKIQASANAAKLSALKAGIQEEQQRQQAEQNLQENINKQDEAGAASLNELMTNSGFGQKLGAALSIMAGSLSQAFTGNKSNPALDVLSASFEKELEKRKLSAEQKIAAKKALLDEVKLRMEQEAQKTDSDLKKAHIAEIVNDINMKKQKLQVDQASQLAAQAAADAIQGGNSAIPVASKAIADKNQKIEQALAFYDSSDPKKASELRERQVVLPNGELVFAKADPQRVREFEKSTRRPNESALNTLESIKKFAKTASSLSPQDRAKMGTMLAVATGKLREPITGPGAMTPEEHQRLLDALGNPTAIFSINENQMTKLNTVMNSLRTDLKSGAAQIGVKWPDQKEDKIRENLRQKGYTDSEIDKALLKR